ncbi:putative F-box associated interaction domain-containing protein [Helianthus debilis subsp. tardiflorus]
MKQSMKTDKRLVSSRGTHSSTSFCSLNLDSPPTVVELETPFDTTRFPDVLGTCHGLVCLSDMLFDRFIVLWNPATRKYKVIPTPMVYPLGSSVLIAVDQVGYDHVNDDYKVVRLIQTGVRVWLNSKVFVYSWKLNVWQSLEQRFPYHFSLALCQGQGVVNVWVMGEYGMKESWSKLVALTSGNVSRCVFLSVSPITYLKNRKEVVVEVNQQWFEIYDLEEKTYRQIMIGDASRRLSTYIYQESLFKL